MSFPAPPAPSFSADQATTTTGHFRYEDVTQDGRLIAIAVPPSLAGLWRDVLLRHPGARNSVASGVIPILTRLTITSHDRPIRADRPFEAHAGFELARSASPGLVVARSAAERREESIDERLFM